MICRASSKAWTISNERATMLTVTIADGAAEVDVHDLDG